MAAAPASGVTTGRGSRCVIVRCVMHSALCLSVVCVRCGGSTGFGRDYRDHLAAQEFVSHLDAQELVMNITVIYLWTHQIQTRLVHCTGQVGAS